MPSNNHQPDPPGGEKPCRTSRADKLDCGTLGALIAKFIWVATVISWPILRPMIALDCVIQLVKAMYHWNTPGTHAGIVFLLHFLAFGWLTYLVATHSLKKR